MADDEDLGARIADLGQAVEMGEEMIPVVLGFQQDDVRRRLVLERRHRGRRAAHPDRGLRLLHAPVASRDLDGPGHRFGLAEGLDRDARHGRDHAGFGFGTRSLMCLPQLPTPRC